MRNVGGRTLNSKDGIDSIVKAKAALGMDVEFTIMFGKDRYMNEMT
jgi:hypothetical protein